MSICTYDTDSVCSGSDGECTLTVDAMELVSDMSRPKATGVPCSEPSTSPRRGDKSCAGEVLPLHKSTRCLDCVGDWLSFSLSGKVRVKMGSLREQIGVGASVAAAQSVDGRRHELKPARHARLMVCESSSTPRSNLCAYQCQSHSKRSMTLNRHCKGLFHTRQCSGKGGGGQSGRR
jgi:hypothetical protein